MKKLELLTFAAVLAALGSAGCASSDPDKIRREMQRLTDARRFDDARAVKAKRNAGGIPKTDEERAKEDMIRTVVDPKEIEFRNGIDNGKVTQLVRDRKFDDARDWLWAPLPPALVPAVRAPVSQNREKLLHETVNRTQFVHLTNTMHKAVAAAVAKKDFAAARAAVAAVPEIRAYPKELIRSLDGVRQALVAAGVTADKAQRLVSDDLMRVFAVLFSDTVYRAKTVEAGEISKPDEALCRSELDAFRKTLDGYGVAAADADKIERTVDALCSKLLRELWIPQEATETFPPDAIGTTKLNELLHVEKTNLLASAVVPAQIAHLAKELRGTVVPLVESGRFDEARAFIHRFGVTGDPAADAPVFAVKLALLNACVNAAEWRAREASLASAVETALASDDFAAATDAIQSCKLVPTYGAPVAAALKRAADGAAALGLSAADAASVVASAREKLDAAFAARPGADADPRFTADYRAAVEDLAGGPAAAEPDWRGVEKALADAAALLVKDDMPKADADALMAEVLAGFKSIAAGSAPTDGPEAITTEQLNKRLSDRKAELSAKVSAAVAAKLAAEEKAKAERAAKAAAEKAAKLAAEEKAQAREMRKIALEMARRAAAAVDFDARINAFVSAVGDRTDPDLGGILGDGARILRLRRAGAAVSPADATSLLVAAVYMGFDDVMNLALALGADVDGAAAKDGLARPAQLIALQYGFKGHAASVLAQADARARDARGDGALHYAVRGGNGTALVELLQAGLDAKKPGAGGATPIVLAADLGYAGLLQALIPFSDLEAGDGEGFTPLLRAAQNGRLDIVRTLVAAGAKLDAKTAAGDGALELAAKAHAPELLSWLLDERGVAPTARTVSQLVVAGDVPTLQLVVAHGGKLLDAHLAAAVKRGDFPMVKYLVNQGMDVNAEVVKKASRDANGGGANDGSYYGPDGGSIADFLRAQGQRL